jgi:hypothetical protein
MEDSLISYLSDSYSSYLTLRGTSHYHSTRHWPSIFLTKDIALYFEGHHAPEIKPCTEESISLQFPSYDIPKETFIESALQKMQSCLVGG